MGRSTLVALIFAASMLCAEDLAAQERKGTFKDTLDNAFDISKWLFELHGFIPLVSPITEPAIGYGAAVAGVYFIPKKNSTPAEFKMPDITGLAGGYTQNGTWFAGGGYFGFWKNNQIWYRGVLGYGNIHLKYFGSGGDFLAMNPVNFRMQSVFFLQQALFRIGQSGFLIGGNYQFDKTQIFTREGSDIPGIDPRDYDLINSSISAIAEYESLNNILSPSRGVRVHLSFKNYLEILGSDRNSFKLNFFTFAYLPVVKRWVSGFRIETLMASDNTPFYLNPFINLRGIPILRYQGQLTFLAETEQFINVYKRWSLVAFTGYGRTMEELDSPGQGVNAWNAGGGFRYLIARALGLQMGIDVGVGPEDVGVYIIFGTAWLK